VRVVAAASESLDVAELQRVFEDRESGNVAGVVNGERRMRGYLR